MPELRVFRLDQAAALQQLRACAQRLLEPEPEVLEVRLFGSLARGEAGPGSDGVLRLSVSQRQPGPDERGHAMNSRLFSLPALLASGTALAVLGCDCPEQTGCPPVVGASASGGLGAGATGGSTTAGSGNSGAGAFSGNTGGTAGAAATTPVDPGECPDRCPDCATRDPDELFGLDPIPRFDLTLPEDRWQYLQAHALDEQYVPACLAFQGQAVGPVGLRFKGSYGTLIPCFDEQGQMICRKLGMKVKFDEVDSNLRFFGLKRLNFNSMINDDTKLHEWLGYDLYRQMGVQAPRSSWAVLTVNGTSYGLFSMVEQVDGRFTAERWPTDGDGSLYQEAWPRTTSRSYYAERLENNQQTATHDAIAAFAAELGAAAPEELGAVLERWMDVDYLARYMAVDDAIFNCDGITAFYRSEDGNWSGNHNYYFYQEKQRDFFWLIPWDLDATFQTWTSWSLVPHWDVVPDDCDQAYPVWSGDTEVVAPGCDRFFQALAQHADRYRAAVTELLEGPFAESALLGRIDELGRRIEKEVAADPLGDGLEAWQGAVARLKSNLPLLRERLRSLRDGVTIHPFVLERAGRNDFEQVDQLGLELGATLYHNPASSVRASITRSEPLEGSQSLRIEFEYRDGAQPWDQWLNYLLAFAGGLEDLRPLRGLRLLVRADRARTLRVDLDSPRNSRGSEGIRLGWDIRAGVTPAEYELLFSDLAPPSWAVDDGRDPGDPVEEVLSSVLGLVFFPHCVGRDPSGFLGEGRSDPGWVELDAIELFGE